MKQIILMVICVFLSSSYVLAASSESMNNLSVHELEDENDNAGEKLQPHGLSLGTLNADSLKLSDDDEWEGKEAILEGAEYGRLHLSDKEDEEF